MRKNKWYAIDFLDHISNHDKALHCRVCLYVLEVNDDCVYGTTWLPVTEDEDLRMSNIEKLVIVRGAILKSKPLKDF